MLDIATIEGRLLVTDLDGGQYDMDIEVSFAPHVKPQPLVLPIQWGANINGVPWDMNLAAAWEAEKGKNMSLIHFSHTWGTSTGYRAWAAGPADNVVKHGAMPLLSWSSQGGADPSKWRLANITSGMHDAYIHQFARDLKAWGKQILLRWGHEMNGNWYFTWQEQANGNRAGEFVPAWRHIVDIFRAEGCSNAHFVWCPDAGLPFESYFPGSDYVDWLGMDGYNFGYDAWRSFDAVFGAAYGKLLALAPSKPIAICEVGCDENGGDKAAWITDMLKVALPKHYPEIWALCWFDFAMSGRDWRISTSPAALAAFKAGIASEYYLPATTV